MDYPPEPETRLLFGAGASRACINISVFDDGEVEGTESFEVSLSTDSDDLVTLQPGTTVVIILDNDEGECSCYEGWCYMHPAI